MLQCMCSSVAAAMIAACAMHLFPAKYRGIINQHLTACCDVYPTALCVSFSVCRLYTCLLMT
jgi:hypothetical protein